MLWSHLRLSLPLKTLLHLLLLLLLLHCRPLILGLLLMLQLMHLLQCSAAALTAWSCLPAYAAQGSLPCPVAG
jgi:hypothetical protein